MIDVTLICLEQNKMAASRFAQTEERGKMFEIEKQQKIVCNQGCSEDFQRVFER